MDIEKKKLNVTIFGSSGEIGSFLSTKFLPNCKSINLFNRNKNKIKYMKKKLNYKKNIKLINFFNFNTKNEKSIKSSLKKNKKIIRETDLLILTIAEQGEINNFFRLNMKKFNKTIFTNFTFYVIFFRYLFNMLKPDKEILIVLFSGGGSTSYRKNFSSYSLSKLCLVKLTEILNFEINNKKIRFNIISPGVVESKMTRIIYRNKSKVSSDELKKIRKNIKNSDQNLTKIFKTINFLLSEKGKLISGKMISSSWDNIDKFTKNKINNLIKSDLYTLRRKENFEKL